MRIRSGSITAACFPTPHILIRSHSGVVAGPIAQFAELQARQAQALHRTMAERLRFVNDPHRRGAMLTSIFASAEEWRYHLAVRSPHADGRYSLIHAQRFREPITDDSPMLFPIAEPHRFRDGARWDESAKTYVDGLETPASQTLQLYEALAVRRFDGQSGDVVVNEMTLPDKPKLHGMRLLRGACAAQAASTIGGRIAARGGDGSRISRAADGVYMESSSTLHRSATFTAAMHILGEHHDGEAATAQAWLDATYLLYQSPRRRRGVDAVVRTFVVAAGLYLVNRPLTLPHDLDLLAYVHTPQVFRLKAARLTGLDANL